MARDGSAPPLVPPMTRRFDAGSYPLLNRSPVDVGWNAAGGNGGASASRGSLEVQSLYRRWSGRPSRGSSDRRPPLDRVRHRGRRWPLAHGLARDREPRFRRRDRPNSTLAPLGLDVGRGGTRAGVGHPSLGLATAPRTALRVPRAPIDGGRARGDGSRACRGASPEGAKP